MPFCYKNGKSAVLKISKYEFEIKKIISIYFSCVSYNNDMKNHIHRIDTYSPTYIISISNRPSNNRKIAIYIFTESTVLNQNQFDKTLLCIIQYF